MSFDPDIEQKILQCIDEVLETLGGSGRRALNRYLKKDIGLKREEIPEKPELFYRGLNLIFGEQGASAVGDSIAQKLLTSFGLKQKSNLTLLEVIQMIKAAQKKSC
jgi:hypothetical protein